MALLIILFVSFGVSWFMNKYLFQSRFTISAMGRLALSIMLLFTGVAHFSKTEEMIRIMPEFLPYKVQLVNMTGVFELAASIGLLVPQTVKWTSIALILFFLLILPANIIGSLKKVELGGMENGPAYLYFRIPLQLLFIWWTYYFGIRLFHNPLRNNHAGDHKKQ